MVRNEGYCGVSHGKVILIGEHSVVYDQPALVLPLHDARMSVKLTPRTDSGLFIDCEYFCGPLRHAPDMLSNIRVLVERLMYDFALNHQGFNLTVRSTIPHERGMGSSAAVAVATIRAISKFAGRALNFKEEFEYTQIAENIAHSTASGLDSAAVASDSAVWFQRGTEISTFAFDTSAVLVVADTGITGSTREAVSDVRSLLKSYNPHVSRETWSHIHRLGQLSYECADALRANSIDTLGVCMNEAQRILSQLSVSHPIIEHCISAARVAGAVGAKLTGGGRGGCLLALAQSQSAAQRIDQALIQAGAIRTWQVPLQSKGIQ
ncbi:mevalonate kinase [Alloscardovia omnicolens]|uniref:mevalonate kinase n=1 Tax=Alloscardovia omnicolens TaxID=419015 RepID=UPI003A708FDC